MSSQSTSYGKPSNRLVLHRQQSLPPASSNQGSATEEDYTPICFLCRQPGDLNKMWRGRSFDGPCFNAVRCKNHMMKGKPAEQQENLALLHDDPDEWRAQLLPLVVQPGNLRLPAAREEIKKGMRTQQLKSAGRIDDKLLLTQTRFVSYKMFWDRMSETDAAELFETSWKEQGRLLNKNDERVVVEDDNPRIRKYNGELRIKENQSEGEESENEIARGGGMRDVHREGSNRPAREPKQLSSLDVTAHNHMQQPLAKRARVEATLRESASSAEVVAPAGLAVTADNKEQGPTTLSEFMKIKEVLKTDMSQKLALVRSAKGVLPRLRRCQPLLTPSHKEQLT